ncbi:MAG: pyridoxine/pyridoxamine 5'-phosphate oxidase, partial [Flavobacteriaceae bacterium]
VSDNYFQSRPRGSQLGALVSNQSQVIDSRATIEKRLQLLTDQYKHQTIPRPSHWGGYLVSPHSVEFWQGRANRLHDRLEYQRNSSIWAIKRLSP